MCGSTCRLRLDIHSCACPGWRQPGFLPFQTRSAASAKVGMPSARRFSVSGSPPSRASLAVGEGLGARFGERDEREAAESQFPPPALDHEPLDPIPRAGGMNLDVKAVAITATVLYRPLRFTAILKSL